MPDYDDIVKVGVGYGVALLDMTLVTSITVSSVPFLRLLTVAKHVRGDRRVKANGAKDYTGYQSTQWISGFMTLAQFDYLVTTYEGPMTAYSWLKTTSPVRYNAILDMGNVSDYEAVNTTDYGWGLENVLWSLTKIQVL